MGRLGHKIAEVCGWNFWGHYARFLNHKKAKICFGNSADRCVLRLRALPSRVVRGLHAAARIQVSRRHWAYRNPIIWVSLPLVGWAKSDARVQISVRQLIYTTPTIFLDTSLHYYHVVYRIPKVGRLQG
jgi:hypothetical protein